LSTEQKNGGVVVNFIEKMVLLLCTKTPKNGGFMANGTEKMALLLKIKMEITSGGSMVSNVAKKSFSS